VNFLVFWEVPAITDWVHNDGKSAAKKAVAAIWPLVTQGLPMAIAMGAAHSLNVQRSRSDAPFESALYAVD
jgi:hypothetical protein